MKNVIPDNATAVTDPQAGGRYERNTDGTLTPLHVTEPAQPGRRAAVRAPAAPAITAPDTTTPKE